MKTVATRAFLLLLGLVLAGYAVLAPALRLWGTRTLGTVTEVRRQGGERNTAERNRYDYGVGYHFTLPDGRRIEGSATVVGNAVGAGVAIGPAPVRYLAAWPRVNLLEAQARFSAGHAILLAVGAGLLVLACRPADPAAPRSRGKART